MKWIAGLGKNKQTDTSLAQQINKNRETNQINKIRDENDLLQQMPQKLHNLMDLLQ